MKREAAEEKTKVEELRKSALKEQEKMKKELEALEGQVKDMDGMSVMQEQLKKATKDLQKECNDLESQKLELKEANEKMKVLVFTQFIWYIIHLLHNEKTEVLWLNICNSKLALLTYSER